MSVYVDNLLPCLKSPKWRYDKSCHLIADDIDELHNFAEIIGLNRSWFQDKNVPHYDLTANKRAEVIKAGAIPLSVKDFVLKMRKIRTEQKC
jgi:hypothetical protein